MKSIFQLFGLTAMMGILLSATEAKQFEDKFGRVMIAELVSHTGAEADLVKIEKSGKKMDVKIDVFSEKDQQFIRDWMKKTPPTLDYAFRIQAVKKKQSEVKGSRSYFSSSKTEVYVYEITITNLTRQPVSDLRIEHRTASQGRSKSLKFQRGTENVKGPLRYNDQISFISTPAKIQSGSGRSSYGYGSSYSFKESLLGVILRIYGPDGEVVEEWRSSGTRMDQVSWDASEQSDASRRRGFTGEDDDDADADGNRGRGDDRRKDDDRRQPDIRDLDALRKLLESGENPFRRDRGGNDAGGKVPDVKPEDFSKKFGSR